jgi:spore photoproduct lyase
MGWQFMSSTDSLHSRFDKFFIDQKSKGSDLVRRVLSVVPEEKIEWVAKEPFSRPVGSLDKPEFDRSKKNIFITPFKGQFFKRCPGARPGLSCCNYFVLNWGLQCDMDCSYCYLQSFLNTPALTIYSNLDQAIEELKDLYKEMGDKRVRVGTGETVDSLSLDDLTLFSHRLIDFFNQAPNWQLEFKTKSAKVDQFLHKKHAGNVVVSWSINPQNVIEAEEHRTASLTERLEAARRCVDKGFQISFHIDPMIWHEDWRQSYSLLVKEITERFVPESFPYLSVGALRFQPEQRHLMRERFGMSSMVTSAEMFKGPDGKLRYHQALRTEMFQHLLGQFKQHSSRWNIFMCMESPETWLSTTGGLPKADQGLRPLFDNDPVRTHLRVR